MLWLLLVGWLLLNAADWATTATLLVRGGVHEDNPLQAALLARSAINEAALKARILEAVGLNKSKANLPTR